MSKQKKSTKNAAKRTTKAVTKAPAKGDPNLVQLSQMDKGKKAAKKEKPLSLLDAAAQVLKSNGKPMRCKEMVGAVMNRGLWTTDAPTPAATLYSAILREMKKGKDSRFKKTDRGHFALA
jgi:hypothetical protein